MFDEFKKIVLTIFTNPLAHCNDEQRAFVDDWFFRRGLDMARVSFWMGIVLLILGIALIPPFIVDPKIRTYVYLAFGYGLLNSPFWLYQVRKKQKTAAIALAIGSQIAIYAIALIIHYFDIYSSQPINMVIASVIISTLSFYYCAFTPLRNYLINVNSAFILLAEFIAFSSLLPPLFFIPLAALNQFCGLIVAWTSVQRERRFAILEFERQEAASRAITARQEQELHLAEAIHESFAPESSMEINGIWDLEVYRVTGERLGGDWVAFRTLQDGKIAVLIMDASGRGMQAALVVHAVQSLWASSLGDEDFRSDVWLKQLNVTLMRLGRKTLHTLTAAIAEIDSTGIRVWSAGHCPVFVVEESPDQHRVKSLMARGSIIGLSAEFAVQSVEYQFDQTAALKIVLGTDGALEPYLHSRRNNVSNLIDRVHSDGASALGKAGDGDDRTLVIISPKEDAKRRVA